ncbi:hypothetical protein [Streptomyces sp. DHE17-7]|uniref:hypothetical protein n=1 Tax=Streptomyces sp. DHE17-7 TaxID=2759949 RepID=UPI003FA7D301
MHFNSIWTAWKLIQEARADEEDEEFEENKLLKAAERRFGVAAGTTAPSCGSGERRTHT